MMKAAPATAIIRRAGKATLALGFSDPRWTGPPRQPSAWDAVDIAMTAA